MSEEWRTIKGYEGYYEVSNFGRVRSIDRYIPGRTSNSDKKLKGKYLKLGTVVGYPAVGLYKESKNHKGKTMYVHRLVAEAFIDNPRSNQCVNHIDGSRNNNFVTNLEWVTYKENTNHALKIGRIRTGSQVSTAILNGSKVADIKNRLKHGAKCTDIGSAFSVSRRTIADIKNGKTWKHV